ncbi:MAG: shikimate dehydrogenase [Clostridium sp.]|nr:shikimate dehydrogenase [Clostridium sp.]MCM1546734.1 shikimate dehydrogenase [Ruminococcus sp.]
MKKYALIGHPLGHSMSPYIHKRLFEEAGKTAEYSLVDIAPEDMRSKLPELLETAEGLNVTIPHKVAVMDFLDCLDESAQRYDSVNCICRKDGKLTGFNTDCDGFLRSVPEKNLGGNVLLLGCGGVGRMMAVEAARHGAKITMAIISEAKEMAAALAKEVKEKTGADIKTVMTDSVSGEYDLLINATPVGMYPKTDACPVSEEVIGNCKAVFDAIYNPTKTKLIKIAESKGIPAVGGMSMLVLQAVTAHEIWDGDSYTDEQISRIINESIEIVERDF